MFYCVECFSTIQQTAIDNAAIPDVLVYCLIDYPATQRCTTELLEAKLEVVRFEEVTIVENDDPIKKFEYQRADRY